MGCPEMVKQKATMCCDLCFAKAAPRNLQNKRPAPFANNRLENFATAESHQNSCSGLTAGMEW